MTTPFVAPQLPQVPLPPARKKKVLLVDASSKSRVLRAEVMRRLGMEVDSAADISEARSWWRADLYNLVLVHIGHDADGWHRFCDDIRATTPPQQLAFLVGKPEYLADMPRAIEETLLAPDDGRVRQKAVPGRPTEAGASQRWGILEASRRISEVRAASHARAKAVRDLPEPQRDLEESVRKFLDGPLRREETE
jgi:CheY-like chemotaxis protein